MKSLMTLAMISGTVLALSAKGQESGQPTRGPQRSPSAVTLKLRREAAKVATANFSQLFSALSDGKIRPALKLSARQADLADRLEKLTRDVVSAWLLRDLDATPPPPDVLEERLSARGDRLRARIIAHAEAMATEAILTPRQGRTLSGAIGRKVGPLLGYRFGPPAVWTVDPKVGAPELTSQLQEMERTYADHTTGPIFLAMLGVPRFREFLDPKTGEVPETMAAKARPYMPPASLSKDEYGLANRLDSLIADAYRAWLVRDLDKPPLPTRDNLCQRLMEHGWLERSLWAHAELIALEGILTPEQADRCLSSVWKELGLRALLDPALAARLRLSKSQRDEIIFLLEDKQLIWDRKSEAQAPLISLAFTRPDVANASEQIARDAADARGRVDEEIWGTLMPAQARVLRRIMGDTTQQPPRPAAKRKKATRRG
jgi:hypothetical protein